jgi:hypothetical protein
LACIIHTEGDFFLNTRLIRHFTVLRAACEDRDHIAEELFCSSISVNAVIIADIEAYFPQINFISESDTKAFGTGVGELLARFDDFLPWVLVHAVVHENHNLKIPHECLSMSVIWLPA